MPKNECEVINGIKICHPSAKRIHFNFLSGEGSTAQSYNTREYLEKMREMAEGQESTVEGQGIYDVIVETAQNENLAKHKGRQKLVNAIKMGADLCKQVKCDTTTEISLMAHDVINIFRDDKIKVPSTRSFWDKLRRKPTEESDKWHNPISGKKVMKFVKKVQKKMTVL